jgi:hypothetical protein
MADQVFVTNPMNVHLPPTPDNPAGSVWVLQPGVNDVPEAAAADPYVVALVQSSAPLVAQAQADADMVKAVQEAEAARQLAIATAQKTALEALTAAGEEWAAKKQAAMDAGKPFTDPHPDPVTQQSMVMTGATHVFAAPAIIGSAAPPPSATRVMPDLSGDTGTTAPPSGASGTTGTVASTGTTTAGPTGATGTSGP